MEKNRKSKGSSGDLMVQNSFTYWNFYYKCFTSLFSISITKFTLLQGNFEKINSEGEEGGEVEGWVKQFL